jgi:hypothetical protein
MIFNTEQFEKLLEAGKFDEAKKMILEAAAAPLTAEEQSDFDFHMMHVRMKLENAVNRRYRDKLADVVTKLRRIKAAGAVLEDKIRIMDIRAKLSE